MRAAIYVRVSTDHEEQKLSPEHQLMTCIEHAEELGIQADRTLVYNDAGHSGTEMDHRPEVKRLVFDARQGKFDAVIFTAISRFARNLSDALALKKRLERIYGIRIISVEEGYDSAIEGRNSEMIFTVYAMMAAHKSEEMSKAIRRGLRQSAIRGRHIGNVAPYGYMKSAHHRLIPDPASAHVIRLIFRRYLNGLGSNAIAKELNRVGIPTARTTRGGASTKWQASTITAILRNRAYMGTLVANKWRNDIDIPASRAMDQSVRKQLQRNEEDWVVIPNNHEAIVDPSTFEKVQQLLELKRSNKGARRNSHLLTGLMRCGNCGGAMVVSSSGSRTGGRYTYIRCNTVKRIGKDACSNHDSMRYDAVLDAVLGPLRNLPYMSQLIDEAAEDVAARPSQDTLTLDVKHLQEQLAQNERQRKSLLRAYAENIFPTEDIAAYKHDLFDTKNRLEQELKSLEQQVHKKNEERLDVSVIRDRLDVFHHPNDHDPLTIRLALKMLVESIVFYNHKRLEVYYKFRADNDDASLYTSLT